MPVQDRLQVGLLDADPPPVRICAHLPTGVSPGGGIAPPTTAAHRGVTMRRPRGGAPWRSRARCSSGAGVLTPPTAGSTAGPARNYLPAGTGVGTSTARQQICAAQVRLQAAGWFAEGVSATEVSRRLRVSKTAVYGWQQQWRAGGAEALVSKGPDSAAVDRTDGDGRDRSDPVGEFVPGSVGWLGFGWWCAGSERQQRRRGQRSWRTCLRRQQPAAGSRRLRRRCRRRSSTGGSSSSREEEAQREEKPSECGDTGEQRRLLDTLRRRELDAIGEKLAEEFGRPFNKTAPGKYVTGAYRQRFTLTSGRFAMIDDGLGFQLVPWTAAPRREAGPACLRCRRATAVSIGVSAGSGD